MVLQILFRISQSNGRQEIHKMGIFLIEIHPEDGGGFLRGEIRFQILRLNAKCKIRISQSNPALTSFIFESEIFWN